MVSKFEMGMIVVVLVVAFFFVWLLYQGIMEEAEEKEKYPSVLDYDCEGLEEKLRQCHGQYICVTMYSNLMILKGCEV